MKTKDSRKQIARYTRLMYDRGYSVDSEGNISLRISKNRVLITPSNLIKRFVKASDIIEIDMDGKLIKGKRKPSSERFTHLEIYRQCPEVKAVVHSHPPYVLIASALGRNPFAEPFLPEAAMFLSNVKWTPYARPSTTDGAETVRSICGGTQALVLDRHGTFTYSKNLNEAFSLLELMEKVARIDYLARLAGEDICFLSKSQIEELLRIPYGS